MDSIFSFLIALLIAGSGLLPDFGKELSYFASPLLPPKVPKARILFGGDMMFDRSVRIAMEERGDDFILSCLDPILQDKDLVVANLEGPITRYPSKSVGSIVGSAENVTFTFPSTTAKLLFDHNVRLVNLGNNHIMNFSRDGLLQTKEYLDDANVRYFGDPDSTEEDRVARLSVRGIPLSFVNWSDWTSDKTDHTVAQVRKEREKGRVVIVYTHWGDEYVPPPARVRMLAHSFIDAGAEIVIGSHPHVVLEHEIYNGKDIYYSLGNLIFDQYWNEEVRTGLMLDISFGKEGIDHIDPIYVQLLRDRRTCPKDRVEILPASR